MLLLSPQDFSPTRLSSPAAAWTWARSSDGQQLLDHGNGPLSSLPSDGERVLVLPPRCLSWHRVQMPQVSPAKRRAVLQGLLEERLLQEPESLHFALPSQASSGLVWVAVCARAPLAAALAALQQAGLPISRITPAAWPLGEGGDGPSSPWLWWHHQDGAAWLAAAGPLGVACLPWPQDPGHGGDTRLAPLLAQVATNEPGAAPGAPAAFADPALAELAERSLGQAVALLSPAQALLRSAQSGWNLAQFEFSLSPAARRWQRWQQGWRALRSGPAWAGVRWGLAGLLLVQLLGLNAAAWQEQRLLQAKAEASQTLLRQHFPDIGVVLNAPLQMQRELALLQHNGGQAGRGDAETLLSAWGQAEANTAQALALKTIRYQAGSAHFEAASGQDLGAQQAALQALGWRAEAQGPSGLKLSPREAQP